MPVTGIEGVLAGIQASLAATAIYTRVVVNPALTTADEGVRRLYGSVGRSDEDETGDEKSECDEFARQEARCLFEHSYPPLMFGE